MDSLVSSFSQIPTLQPIIGIFTSFWIPIAIIGAILMFIIALYGHKIFDVTLIVVGALVGATVGFVIGSLFNIVVGIIAAILLGAFLAYILRNVGPLLAFAGFLISGGGLLIIGAFALDTLKLDSDDPKGMILALAILAISFVVGVVVAILIAVVYEGAIYLLTSFGGAIAGMYLISSLIPLPFMWIVAIVLGIILGAFCFIFQLTGFKIKLKDFNWKSLLGKPEKKSKKKDINTDDQSLSKAGSTAEAPEEETAQSESDKTPAE